MRFHFLKNARTLAALLPLLAFAQPVAAQRDGSWEFSLGGGATYLATDFATFMGSSGLANGSVTPGRFVPGVVGRVGFNFTDHLGFSVGSGYGTGSGVTYVNPFAAATLTGNINAKTSPFLSLGTQFTRVTGNGSATHSVWGARAGLGVRHMLSENFALRVEARIGLDHFAAMPGSKIAYNPILTAGFSYFVGGYRTPVAIQTTCPICARARVDTVWRTVVIPPPPPLPPIVLRDTLVLEGINFEFDSSALTKESHWILDRVATALLEPDFVKTKWEIAGHTSAIGSHEYNMSLSQRRSESVRAYLLSRGVPNWRLTPRGYGETNPMYMNDSEGKNWRNRRVELRRIKS